MVCLIQFCFGQKANRFVLNKDTLELLDINGIQFIKFDKQVYSIIMYIRFTENIDSINKDGVIYYHTNIDSLYLKRYRATKNYVTYF